MEFLEWSSNADRKARWKKKRRLRQNNQSKGFWQPRDSLDYRYRNPSSDQNWLYSDRCSWKSPLKQQELNTLRRSLNKRIAPKVMSPTLLCPFPILASYVGRSVVVNPSIQWTSFILPCYSVNLAKWHLKWKDVQNRGVLYTPASRKIAPFTTYRRLLIVYGDQTAVVNTGGEWRFSSRYCNMREEAYG